MNVELTQAHLQSLYEYNRETGLFRNIQSGKVYLQEDDRGYIRIKIDGKRYRAHRLAFLYETGTFPRNVDHINGIGKDNRWCNLRECTQAQNSRNRKVNVNYTKSNIKNVVWHEESKRWKVIIVVDSKVYDYGFFYDLEIAELVAIGARVKHHGEYARTD